MLSTLCFKPISTTKPPKLATCWKESAVFVVSAVLAVVSVLLAATVAVYYGKRYKTKGEANRDVQEVTYAEVSFKNSRRNRVERRAARQTVFGEITVYSV
ncbi:hypothetical protein GN956_G26038 [Arapaima gigas]